MDDFANSNLTKSSMTRPAAAADFSADNTVSGPSADARNAAHKAPCSIPVAFRVIIFILLAALLTHLVYTALRWKDTTGNYISSTDQLYATPADTIDVVFAGSSHCYAGIYPAELWADRGIAAFDMAVSGQDKQSTYHDLVEVMKTQHPKVVVADLYGLTFEEHGVRSNEYRNMLALHTSRNSIGLVKDYADRADWLDYILRWPIIHTRYKELQPFDFVENPLNTFGRGALYDWDYNPVTYESSQTAESTPISDTNRRFLDRMESLSERNGFRLVYMILPYSMPEEDRRVFNGMRDYLAEKGWNTDIIDFTDPETYAAAGLDGEMDFHDGGHLSGFGAGKVTRYMENYLDGIGMFADHRGDPAYIQWDQDYTYYNETKYTWVLPRTENVLSYCALLAQNEISRESLTQAWSTSASSAGDSSGTSASLSNGSDGSKGSHDSSASAGSSRIPGLITIISLEGPSETYATEEERTGASAVPDSALSINPDQDYTSTYDGYYAALSLLGMSREDYLSGGKWIYQNGQLKKIHGNDSDEEPFSMDLSASDSLRAQYNGDFAQGNVMINMKDYSNADGRPLHIIVYDDLTDQLIEARGF